MKTMFKKGTSMLLALIMCLSVIAGFSTTAFAAGVESEAVMISFPRDGDANTSGWGHDNLTYMNGWTTGQSNYITIFGVGSFTGNICYCIEPGVPLHIGDALTQKDETFWDNYPSDYNKTIDADTVKSLIGRILQYGYTGTISTAWRSQNSEDADKLSYAYATQILVWETVVGERDENFNHVSTGGYDAVLDIIGESHPLRSGILSYYNSIVTSVQNHGKVPSFCAKSTGKAQTVEPEWDGTQYSAKLTDTNNVLGNYSFSSNYAGLEFSVSGNTLTITTATAPSSTVTITAERNNSQRMGLIVWSDGVYDPSAGTQDLVSYTQSVTDPLKGYVNVTVSYGSTKIVKTSEDGKVDGITFTISGNGVNETAVTQNGGQILLDNLQPGVYTVTEQTYSQYEPQESRRVTVVAGQTATVTFNNTLRRGDLTVTKTSEDGLNEGVTFHLYGASLSGLAVDEYAVTNSAGVAEFKDVLIGTGYVLEEMDTAIRYVVPDNQTTAIEWHQVTNKSFENVLKKFNVTVTKSDAETGTAQGDASLSGAVYGIYKGDQLIDTYTTDGNGQFTTAYYVCDSDWTIREISASEGYLVNSTAYPVGAEPKLYTVEYNAAPAIDALETVQKGNIAIIKHTDDGETQIETPEEGAEFAVYLKSAGSYDAAKATERDYLLCDENGYAATKDLPYGIYTVHQVTGWEGRELMKDFDVFISSDGQTYRYLINNANFESYIQVVKTDAETGKTIPYAGAEFQIYDPSGALVTMTYTYPEITTIDTFYTTADGTLITPEALDYGTGYSLVEASAPYGYVLDSTPVYFDVTQSNATEEAAVTIVKVEVPNMPQKGTITVTKSGEVFAHVTATGGGYVDEDGNEFVFPIVYQPVYETAGLAGAVYEVTAAEDVVTPDGTLRYSKGEVVAVLTTGSDSSATTGPMYLGRYEIREITAPYGAVINEEIRIVELNYAGQEVEITETAASFYNERQRVQISLTKILEQNDIFGIGMNGEITAVSFGLYAAEDLTAADGSVIPQDGLIEIAGCDENGCITFATDIPVGAKLYVREVSTDSHYVLSDQTYPVEFEYAGQDVATVSISVNDGEAIANEIVYGKISGLKVDRENEETVAGAVFGLLTAEETEFAEADAILTAQSDEGGIFVFEAVPYGNWIVKELQPAEGFLPNEESYPVEVTEDEQVIEITVVNDRIPEIGTTATVDGEKEINATEVFTLEDVVEYQHLIPGKEYTLEGVLMDKATGEPLLVNDEEVRSAVTFIPEEPCGSVTVEFTFDAKYIKAETDIVAFESLYRDGVELAVHADIEDEGQTVTVHVPEIGTTANVEGEKEVNATEVFTLEDVVEYQNLTPGKEYTVMGILMDKATGKPLMVDDAEVRAETTFTPEESSGSVTVEFTFDARYIKEDTEVVVFESLYRDGMELAVHADIEDEGQTVTVHVPEIGTQASVGGKKEVTAGSKITIDDVVAYTNLTPGKEYTIEGVLMDQATGEPFLVNGEEVRSAVTFTPDTADGEVTVSFTFNGSAITKDTEIVVFETLYRDGVEIAVHTDIEDEGQTVTIHPQPTPDVPQTGDTSNMGFWLGLGAVALGGLAAVVIFYFKRKKDDGEK